MDLATEIAAGEDPNIPSRIVYPLPEQPPTLISGGYTKFSSAMNSNSMWAELVTMALEISSMETSGKELASA